MRNVIAMLLVGVLSGCQVDDATFQRVMADEGYINPVNTGWTPFDCSDDDTFVSGFTATRSMPDGTSRPVTGTVCCGWLKNCTVRH